VINAILQKVSASMKAQKKAKLLHSIERPKKEIQLSTISKHLDQNPAV
jgi:hypothetical protein